MLKSSKNYSKLSLKFIYRFRKIQIKEQQKISNLLNEANDSKWNIVNHNSKSNYDATNEITNNTEILKSSLCEYNDTYILVKGDISVVRFKNWASFIKCITKIDETAIDDAEDLYLVIPMYNLIEYSSNYSETTGNLWFYSEDEATNTNPDIVNDDNFKSFKYRAKLLGNTATQDNNAANGNAKNAIIPVPLKYLCNFWRSLEIRLTNCKVELKFVWTKHCALSACSCHVTHAFEI